ncbi:MAG: hypothetical protein JKY51_05780 [Opitutaceae bacterium]|nr:hypothetical protein [Opitutaceae bacterium]
MLGLFARFSDLYGELARHKGLEIYRGNNPNELTREFQLWCMKLDSVDMQGIARGVEALEKQIEENSAKGEKSWPPSYAEFKGMCKQSTTKALYKQHIALPSGKELSKEELVNKMADFRKKLGL